MTFCSPYGTKTVVINDANSVFGLRTVYTIFLVRSVLDQVLSYLLLSLVYILSYVLRCYSLKWGSLGKFC